MQYISNMRGGYLPLYLHSRLEHILGCKTFPICVVDIYHRICTVDWCIFCCARPFQYAWWISTTIFLQWTGAYFGLQYISNMRGGYLPPYFYSGLVHILGCKTFPICVVDTYHHIFTVVSCIFWDARPFQYVWWISTTVFA